MKWTLYYLAIYVASNIQKIANCDVYVATVLSLYISLFDVRCYT